MNTKANQKLSHDHVEKTPKWKKARNQLGFSHRPFLPLSIANQKKTNCTICNPQSQMANEFKYFLPWNWKSAVVVETAGRWIWPRSNSQSQFQLRPFCFWDGPWSGDVGDGRYRRWRNGGAISRQAVFSMADLTVVMFTDPCPKSNTFGIQRRHNGDFNFRQIVSFNTIRISSLDHTTTLIIHHEKFIPKLARFQLNSTSNIPNCTPLGNWLEWYD